MSLASLKDNLGIKLISLILGTSLYVYVQTLETSKDQKTFTVPLRMTNVGTELVVNSILDMDGRPKRDVTITVKGPVDEISQLDTKKLESSVFAQIDLSGIEPGDSEAIIRLTRPRQYRDKFEWTHDDRVKVVTERIKRESKPITVVTTGSPKVGLDYGAATVEPSMIQIAGAESRVNRVKTARVLLDLDKATSGVSGNIIVELLDRDELPVPGVTATPEHVSVRPVLTPSAPWREVFVSAQFDGVPAVGYRVNRYLIDPDVVRVVGDPRLLRLQGTVATTPIDLSGQRQPFQRVVDLMLPRGLRLKEPLRVKITIDIQPDPLIAKPNGSPNTSTP